MSSEVSAWNVCSTCKKPIGFGQTYYLCNVSTCNRKRTGFYFCAVACWDAHVPMMRHRDAWAEQNVAPSRIQWEQAQQAEQDKAVAAQARAESLRAAAPIGPAHTEDLPRDVLIVVSKLKNYIKQHSNMNTSESVTEVLSDHIRDICAQAIANAAEEGRKTVMDRDFLPLFEDRT